MEIRSSNIPFTQALTSHPSLPVHQNNPRPYFHSESSRLAASRPLQFAILVSLAITIAECFIAKTSPAPRHGLLEASRGAPPALALHVVRQTASRSFLFYLIATTSTAYQPHPSSRSLARHHTRRVSSLSHLSCLLAILLVASYSPSYSSSLTRYHTRRVSSLSHLSCLLAILLVASRLTRFRPRRRYPHRDRSPRVVLYNFPLSVPLRAALTMSRSSPIYSPRLTRHPTRQVLLAILLVKSYSLSLVVLTHHHTRRVYSPSYSSRRVLAACILIEIVLVASYCTTSHCLCL